MPSGSGDGLPSTVVEEKSIVDEMDEAVKPVIVKVTLMLLKPLAILVMGASLAVTLPAISSTITTPVVVVDEAPASELPAWIGIVKDKVAQGAVAVGNNAKSALAGVFNETEKFNRLQEERDQLVRINAALRKEIAAVAIGVNVDHMMATNCAIEVVEYLKAIGEASNDSAKDHY